jgi:imidazolonepropionase
MSFCIALAVRDMRLSIDEALAAATRGGARALRRDDVGVLRPGLRADAVVLAAPSYEHLVYRPGVPLIAGTLLAGELAFADRELLAGQLPGWRPRSAG